jgi:hypothetical protein
MCTPRVVEAPNRDDHSMRERDASVIARHVVTPRALNAPDRDRSVREVVERHRLA